VTLPEVEANFYLAVLAQLEPAMRPVFVERVAQALGALPWEADVGDVDRAVRQALVGLWTPPECTDPSRWARATPKFEKASRRAY
jgi:hypothetical protein